MLIDPSIPKQSQFNSDHIFPAAHTAVATAVERDMAVDMASLPAEAPRSTPKDTDLVDLDTVVETVDTAVETVDTAVDTVDTAVDIPTSTALMLDMEDMVDPAMGVVMGDLDMDLVTDIKVRAWL